MRLAILTPTLGGGGAERQIELLAGYLIETGHDVEVITLYPLPAGVLERSLAPAVVRTSLDLTGWGGAASLVRLTRRLRRSTPQIVLAFNIPAIIAARIVVRQPLVTSVRSTALPPVPRRLLLRLSRARDDAVVFNSHVALSDYVRQGLVLRERALVIPNAVVVPAPKIHDHVEPAAEADGFRWVAVGRLTEAKGFDVLIAAISRLRSTGYNATVDILGVGPDAEALRGLAERLGVEDAVQLRGFVDGWTRDAHLYDGFVLSSRWEGSPNVALEAVMVGKASVVTDVGDLGDTFPRHRVAAAGDTADLVRAMAAMMDEDPVERSAVATALRQRLQEVHSAGNVHARWVSTLATVAGHAGDHVSRP